MSIDSILIVLTSPQRGGSMYAANDRPVWCRGPPPPRRPYCLSLIFMLAHLKSQRNPSVFNLFGFGSYSFYYYLFYFKSFIKLEFFFHFIPLYFFHLSSLVPIFYCYLFF
jgi:hypothetical protein